MDVSTDSPAGRWMTLKELAETPQISVASTARLMRRRRSHRQPGNDGHIRVLVPADDQQPKVDARPDVVADIRADVMEVIRPLRDAIAALRLQLDEANARALRAEQAVAGERVRADVLRDRIEALQGELRQEQDIAEQLRQAEAARRSLRLLAPLKAAWWGQ